jgi:hypothetical protein
MKRHRKLPVHEDERLHSIAYCVGDGLRKLIPTDGNWGWPAYTKYGVANSDHHDYYEDGAQEHLVVSLWIRFDAPDDRYYCCITIKDGDDFILQRWMEFTFENWQQQLDLYNGITQFDRDVREYLELEGFD